MAEGETRTTPEPERPSKRVKTTHADDSAPPPNADHTAPPKNIDAAAPTPANDVPSATAAASDAPDDRNDRRKGLAPIKAEYLIDVSTLAPATAAADDDDAEAAGKDGRDQRGGGQRAREKTKGPGQNKGRTYGSSRDEMPLCVTRARAREFDPVACPRGDKCRFAHDIREYVAKGKRADLDLYKVCPVFEAHGYCPSGWKCRFAGSHSKEVAREDGRMEMVLVSNKDDADMDGPEDEKADCSIGNVNRFGMGPKVALRKDKLPLPKTDTYLAWLEERTLHEQRVASAPAFLDGIAVNKADLRAMFTEAPLRPSEKRRIYYGPETPVLAPLTTQGNLPFRRLCVSLGAEITWSEMAMGTELLQGAKPEWALTMAHSSEIEPPKSSATVVNDYNNKVDLKFGVQIAANKPRVALRTTEVLTTLLPHLRAIDLNCGCPIDMVFNSGAGSALLDSHGKLETMLRGMNTVSGPVPITVKIRMGTKDKSPNATKLCRRLALGGGEGQRDPSGVAAITLHGRSRQQRYTRSADWGYIADCANLVRQLKAEHGDVVDTVREPDARDLPVTNGKAGAGMPYFVGNGDILSHVDWEEHMSQANVDSCMIGRGALIKPWIFEEIAAGQYLDKSGSERMALIEQFVRNGLDHWGSDEMGVGNTRRFLLEWLSFSCRYVPLGILEHLPPRLGDRPPAFRGRDDTETLLSSANYKDWIKISEMFLGPATKDFQFQPKHKSNSYDIEAQG